jgi:hypothetical protein
MSRFPRDAVDAPLVKLFRQHLLDEKATLATIERASRTVRADAERALREAEHEATLADSRLARVRRDYLDGGLTLAEWRSFAGEIESERHGALAEVEGLRGHVQTLSEQEPIREARQLLHDLLDEIRGLADRYEPEDDALVQALRTAMAQVVERIIIHPLDAAVWNESGRTVFLPYFKPLSLSRVENAPFASMIWSVPSGFVA